MKRLSTRCLAAILAFGGFIGASPAWAGKTLDGIKSRGQVVCGVHTGLAGFSAADSAGKWTGLDVDVCRAVAAAGGQVLAQDEASSVVWGMPGAVSRAGLAGALLPPEGLGERIGVLAGSAGGRAA